MSGSKGCGCTTGLLSKIRPPEADTFYVACCIHDDDYDRGGTKQERKEADEALLFHCLRTVTSKVRKPRELARLIMVSWCYYWSVRLMGWHYFNYNSEP